MNKRDKELAKQALTENDWDTYVHIAKFAELIRADEREACAKVCEGVAYVFAQPHHYAAIIRERGNT